MNQQRQRGKSTRINTGREGKKVQKKLTRPSARSLSTRGVSILTFLHRGGGERGSNQLGLEFSSYKREVFSGTKIYLIWILCVIFEFSAICWLLGTKYLNFGANILILGSKRSKSCLFKVNRGGRGGFWGLREVSASESGKIFLTPLLSCRYF